MGYSLGIDFGTSTTKVAIREGSSVYPLPIGKTGEFFMPSVVAYEKSGNDMAEPIAVGEDATEVPETDRTRVVREIKRCLATAESANQLLENDYPWWNRHDRRVTLWSSTFNPHDVALSILNEALDRAVRRARERGFGADVDRFTIRGLPTRLGCSVTSGLETRRILAEVARRLGFPEFKVGNLCAEPILASLSYVHLQEVVPGETILIYDLGGGTFDTAVVKFHEQAAAGAPVLTVFSADGEAFCGGADIDDALFKHLMHTLADELGFKKEMNSRDKQLLRNRAREAKEILSQERETTIALPLGVMDEVGGLSIKRTELESIVRKTGLLDKTLECVLRAWRRARMLLRKESEAVGAFHLRYDESSGLIGGSVFQLGHQDLKENVDRLLIVGGTTRMPLIRQRLASLWGTEKLVSEGVVQPVEAASIGAAWQQEDMGVIVDRLPFSVTVYWDGGEHELYRAFTPTVSYRTLTTSPSINPFRSLPVSLSSGCNEATIVLRNADGHIVEKHHLRNVPLRRFFLEIDMFGRCIIKTDSGMLTELPNPFQHPLQKELCERIEEDRRRQEEKERKRSEKMLTRSPFLEND